MTKNDLTAIKSRLIAGVKEYQKDCDGAYHFWDVWKLQNILNRYYKQMELCHKRKGSDFMEIVKKTVLALNELNEKCGDCLIETDQREDICEYIIKTAYLFNFIQSENEDITGEWREW